MSSRETKGQNLHGPEQHRGETGPTREAYIRALQAAESGTFKNTKVCLALTWSYVGAPVPMETGRVNKQKAPSRAQAREFLLHFTKYASPCCTDINTDTH